MRSDMPPARWVLLVAVAWACVPRAAGAAEPEVSRTRASEEYSEGYVVRAGDTLDALIIRNHAALGNDLAAARRELVAANPRAFVNGDPNRLVEGARLKLPAAASAPAKPGEEPGSDDDRATDELTDGIYFYGH